MSSVARAYLEQVLDIMQTNSINRYKIDWPAFRQRTLEQAGNARTTRDTYPAIRFAITLLGDNHSFFREPGTGGPSGGVANATSADPEAALLEGVWGYVLVPAFSGGGMDADDLAQRYHRLIEGVDTLGACGWVVDLRGNTGGNMWPMVAGVGPIVGEGVLGLFVDPDSVVSTWTYSAGRSELDGATITRVGAPYELLNPDPPVAVLTDSLTASSGEATTIAFRGRSDARSFGRPTRGISTANRAFGLSDGARLFLTVSTMADRTGQLYGQEVVPDVDVPGARTGDADTDDALAVAVGWLGTHPACST